ncbi:BnaC06g12740D [Brassica napus]|uniref:BnaC06g12740D protein n=1 Tax=Brassica napus TaxID=3708 RepID=A0A078FEI5_BRANA|nr:BnaC06g12740D [Brassica napus]
MYIDICSSSSPSLPSIPLTRPHIYTSIPFFTIPPESTQHRKNNQRSQHR